MKKRLVLFGVSILMISILTFGTSAGAALHDPYDPGSGIEATVSGDASQPGGDNKDYSKAGKNQIGTDFYIVDYQNKIPTYQLKVEVPMYVSLAVVGDGEVAVPSQNAYGLRNFTGYPVDVTDVTVQDNPEGWNLVPSLASDKDLIVNLEGKNILDLDNGSKKLSQLPKAENLNGSYVPYPITAEAQPGKTAPVTGYAFSITYTLALNK